MNVPMLSETFRPQLRAEVIFGPPILTGNAVVYYLKDTLTDWFYRVGAREHFLISRMDGQRTLLEIEQEYEATFGRQLHERSWAQLFGLLARRRLLVGSGTLEDLTDMKQVARRERRMRNSGFLRWHFPVLHPDSLLTKVERKIRFAFHPAFVYPALVVIIAFEIFFFLHIQTMMGEMTLGIDRYLNPFLIALLFVLVWIFLLTHEFAHGLTCKHFGGAVLEIGLVWRYFALSPYCRLDDVVLFHNRWHRVYAAFAGIFINLLMITPIALLWQLSPAQSMLHLLCATILVTGNLATLVNLVPFAELDGYLMLNYTLNMIDLRKDAYRYWRQSIKRMLSKQQGRVPCYDGRCKQIYLLYGPLSFLSTCAFTVSMFVLWFRDFRMWFGTAWSWLIFPLFLLVLVLANGSARNWLQKLAGAHCVKMFLLRTPPQKAKET